MRGMGNGLPFVALNGFDAFPTCRIISDSIRR